VGIQVTNTAAIPVLEFKNVHLVRLNITQPLQENNSLAANYHVMIVYRLFGVDGDGKRHYRPEEIEIEIDDFLTMAMTEYAAGDPTLIMAFKSIETAIAALITKDQGLSTKVT
jgi:hypothetical protein